MIFNVNILVFIILVIFFLMLIYIVMKSKKSKKTNQYYYFDNNATTIYIDDKTKKEIKDWLCCGNPSNTNHDAGKEAKFKNNQSMKIIADDLKVNSNEIYLTSNATEANNIAIQGFINYFLKKNIKFSVLTSNIEHPNVLEIFKKYQEQDHKNLKIIILPIETNIKSKYYGVINPETLIKTIEKYKKTYPVKFISIMYANNETGAINDIKKIGEIANNNHIVFHSDCTQAIGKYIIHPEILNIHSLTFSGHKIHAPKGVGCLYIKDKIIFDDLSSSIQLTQKCDDLCSKDLCGVCFGGHQSFLRPGTENVAFNAALASALKIVHTNREEKNKHLDSMKKYIIKTLCDNTNCINIKCNYQNLNNTISLLFPKLKISNQNIARLLNDYGICVGTNSACSSDVAVSYVIDAMNIDKKYQDKVIRISLCDYNTIDECKYLCSKIKKIIKEYTI